MMPILRPSAVLRIAADLAPGLLSDLPGADRRIFRRRRSRGSWVKGWGLGCLLLGSTVAFLPAADAAEAPPVVVDRVLVRFSAPEMGGDRHPQFVFERELAFEAQLLALERGVQGSRPYHRSQLLAAFERHAAEVLLGAAPILYGEKGTPDPVRTERELLELVEEARQELLRRLGGTARLDALLAREGFSEQEFTGLLRRRARAALFLHTMVAPLLHPTAAELRRELLSGRTPFYRGEGEPPSVSTIEPALRRYLLSERLSVAAARTFAAARGRLRVTWFLPEAGEAAGEREPSSPVASAFDVDSKEKSAGAEPGAPAAAGQ